MADALPNIANIKKLMAGGVAWMVTLRFANRIIGLVSTVILARLLVPADFGLIALASTTVAMVEMAGELGLELALIRDRNAQKSHYDTVWTMRIIKGLITSGLLVLLAPYIAEFFEEPRLTEVIYALAFVGAVQSFSNIGTVDFTKKLEFGKVFIFRTTKKLVQFAVTVSIAYIWRTYWALVAGIVASGVLAALFSYLIHPYRPKFSLQDWREIFGFSKWILVSRIASFFNKNTDKFLIGKLASMGSVGLFSVAKEISTMVSSELIAPVKQASLPAFSELAGDLESLKTAYLQLISVLVFFSLPLAAGVGLTADLLVKILLGQKWLEAIPLIAILAIAGLIEAAGSQTRPLFIALNKPQIPAYVTIFKAIIFVPLFFYALQLFGLRGGAWAFAITTGVILVIDFILVSRIAEVKIASVTARLWRPVLSVGVMYWLVSFFRSKALFDDSLGGNILELLVTGSIGAFSYFSAVFAIWHLVRKPGGAEVIILEWLNKSFKKRR